MKRSLTAFAIATVLISFPMEVDGAPLHLRVFDNDAFEFECTDNDVKCDTDLALGILQPPPLDRRRQSSAVATTFRQSHGVAQLVGAVVGARKDRHPRYDTCPPNRIEPTIAIQDRC